MDRWMDGLIIGWMDEWLNDMYRYMNVWMYVFYCNYIPGRQVYCIMQEMLGHLPHGSINEILAWTYRFNLNWYPTCFDSYKILYICS